MNKKVIAIILMTAMVFSLCTGFVYATQTSTVTASSVSGADNETIDVLLSVSSDALTSGICGYMIELSYDKAYLTLVTEDGFVKSEMAFELVEYNPQKQTGDKEVIAVSALASDNIMGDTLFTQKFLINDNSGASAQTNVIIETAKLYYIENGSVMTCDAEKNNAVVTINPTTPTPSTTPTATPTSTPVITGGGGGGGGGVSISPKPTVTENADGSTTITTTDSKTGTVTEKTQYPGGETKTVETKKDGTVTTTRTDAYGNIGETVTNPDGTTSVEATISKESASNSSENGTIISLPIEPVESKNDADATQTISVSLPTEASVKIKIPVADAKSGTVAVIVNEDGSTEVIRKTVLHEDGLILSLEASKTIKIIDNSKSFEDTIGHWGEEYIDFVTSRELFNGTSDTTFEPDAFMTRAMITRVLHNYENNPEHSFDGSFADVGKGEWYSDSVMWAAEKGIVKGYEDGSFGVDGNMTREDLAVILYRYAGAPSYVGAGMGIFTDVDKISDYAVDAISWAVEKGIIGGIGDNKLDPKGNATRAQVATMLQRFFGSYVK
ncbi:MAG: S-layer homology domain-containing protein [Ruminococcaceae bacterium]|nr:S-layer homology domain-containing protein [Oscillospiraceae bacterium]